MQNQVFNEASDRVVGERGGNGCAQSETAPQRTRDVVFAAALPHLKTARGVDAAFAGIEAQHHLAQAHDVQTAIVFFTHTSA
jgi:hypothetical protein